MDRLNFPLENFVRLLAACIRCNLIGAGEIDCNNLHAAITVIFSRNFINYRSNQPPA